MNKKILYVGGFELPDKNAAAHRVIANGKIFNKLGYEVDFLGITQNNKVDEFWKCKGKYQGFNYWTIPYPTNNSDWLNYVTSIKKLKKIIKKNNKKYSHIIIYNFPAIASIKLINYCKKKDIKLIADCTEWYGLNRYNLRRILKFLDSELRMRLINKKVDGVICISGFLADYYDNITNKIILPPLVDTNNKKWNINVNNNNNKLSFIYAGSPGSNKDRINLVIESLINVYNKKSNIEFNLVGLDENEYLEIYPEHKTEIKDIKKFTNFYGRISHEKVITLTKKSDFTIFFREKNKANMAGFPTKFVESFTCGTPVITNKTSDLKKYLKEGKNGFWIDVSNKKKINKKLLKITNLSSEKIEFMSNYTKGNNYFDYKNKVNLLEKFLNQISN
ncbi:glycosyltransferase involved in cell wall biosynthesis [Halanaerobium saccharolyticum]|uniref:Glycosyltransferase involved in cell wall biosynthesis n=1 Tax=Halanaerobium saccharolyticum TaxID=43595 RepID=A0A4R6LYX1_9FIRM|nr:glycosyltransferase [Halanaerobium saccharolyticum]TDO94088.1 glycosyltransferase involved in cell wall biosynthesis [Halanaerobium saccharolyticum]